DRYELRLSQAQRMEAIGTLASGIAHDFNNMLSAIMGYTELARRQLQNEESQAVRNLEQVLKAGMRARDLVAQLLSIGRNYKAERETVKVNAVVREALNLLRATLPTTIEIRTALHPEAGTVYADPTEIHQLIMNLCTNAYQAMEEKGGLLLITLEPVIMNGNENAANIQPPISEGAYVKLVVSDTGCGMDEDVIRHIFDPFFTTKERGKGTGLGLATVSRIVADLKGGVAVKSNPGEGAEFTLYLPRYDFKAKNPKKR
ncbi:MAG TPA: ATP-binding protein, partial [Deltaproteobacteria bacterium]|nr:ATP-binding protein [Deltaproteobacteria bacterium]